MPPPIEFLIRGVKRSWWVLLFLGFTSTSAFSAPIKIVLSDDSAPYQEVYEVIRAHLDARDVAVERIYAEAPGEAATGARLLIAVGVRAAESVANLRGKTPVLAALVPREWYRKSGRQRLQGAERRPVSAIYLDQPFERQAQFIRLAFPNAKKVGVLLSTAQVGLVDEIETALRGQRLGLVSEILAPEQKLIEPLERIFTAADLLLAIPDPDVFNRNTAQSILLTSYRYRDPVVGYSRSLARAGAMVSLFSTPAQIGRQAAELVENLVAAAQIRLPSPAAPRYFTVIVNQQVARSLGFDVLPEAELEHRLEGIRND